MLGKRRVLFLCTGNSCRSQMGEGWLRELAGERYESLSAGAKPTGNVNPLAIEVMREVGIDLSRHVSQSMTDFLPPDGEPPDLIISVCDAAAKECPAFPGTVEHWHWPFDDPADAEGTADERLQFFRRVRDEIRSAIVTGLLNAENLNAEETK